MGQALYRKYRSKSFQEVVGQEHITDTLERALKSGKISHAYLFTGPRGVGKTSVARILAHAVNDLPYDELKPHLDIIEIDAASNRRIDEIRELRERVHIAPAAAKYKVYIIDEVHMLTKEAFNALLKTLEEPPAHAIFILATTESHKVPETIVSRTQRFAFKPVTVSSVMAHLKDIAHKEKLTISDEALELLAQHGGGSFRDSISLLDQVSASDGKIERRQVEAILGLVADEEIASIIKTIELENAKESLKLLDNLLAKSTPAQISKQLAGVVRKSLVAGKVTPRLTSLGRELIEVPSSHDPTAALQLSVLVASLPEHDTIAPPNPTKQQPVEPPTQEPTITPKDNRPEPVNESPLENSYTHEAIETENIIQKDIWMKTLAEIKKHHATLYGIARMATATVTGSDLHLLCEFPFHQKQLSDAKNLQIIADTAKRLSGDDYTIKVTLSTTPKRTQSSAKTKSVSAIETISNIFGDAEVLES